MYITTLKFEQVLDKFYRQQEYNFMLLFVSSFDEKDKDIIRGIIDNARRIDRITGNRICFFYFVEDLYDDMNKKLAEWVRHVSLFRSLSADGVSVTMETADDICSHFHILRSNLPAFILISDNPGIVPKLFNIQTYQDFEYILTPLNILHTFIEDRDKLIDEYNRQCGVREQKLNIVKNRDVERKSWSGKLNRLERKQNAELSMGLIEQAQKREPEIQKLKQTLADNPQLQYKEIEEIVYPFEELERVRRIAIKKLNISLNIAYGDDIIKHLSNPKGYSDAVLSIFNLISSRDVRMSRKIEIIRQEICDKAYDVIISCKSQDYENATELYNYLIENGFKPFFAGVSIYEVGMDQFTIFLGELLDLCTRFILFATKVDYIQTPYVSSGWHAFINDMNTGKKPDAKLVNVLSPDIYPLDLPAWLRDKQCFTTKNYKNEILNFLQ